MVIYKTINTRTLEGLRKAEKLKSLGWVIYSIGFNTISFYKKNKGGENENF